MTFSGTSSALDVTSDGTSLSRVSVSGVISEPSGMTVNLVDTIMPAGTYTLISNAGALPATLPTLGTNACGKTPVFAWVPGTGLVVTLYPVPTVSTLNPSSGGPTIAGTSVTITGTGLSGATAVSFGGTAATITANSATQITASAPAHAAGTVDVIVTTPWGISAVSGSDKFTYVVVPTTTTISPVTGSTAGGTLVTMTGSGFTGASTVTFDGIAAGSFTVISDTRITARSPAHGAGPVFIVVTTGGGTATWAYTYLTPPVPTPASTTQNPIDSSGNGGSDLAPSGTAHPTPTQGPSGTLSVNVGGNTPVSSVDVTGTGISGIIITATEASGPGQNIQSPPGNIYLYMDISPTRYGTIAGAPITFTVPQSWLDEHHLTPQDIVLYHNVGTGWQALPITVVKTQNGQVFFTATSPGFSRFAIAGQAGSAPATAAAVPTHVQTMGGLVKSSDAESSTPVGPAVAGKPVVTQTTTAPPAPVFPLATIGLIGTGCLVLIGSGWYVRCWYIRRQNPALFRKYD